MKFLTARRHQRALIPLCTVLLGACNGGGTPAPGQPVGHSPAGKVVVAGDSLADVGAFGAKATIQNSADPVAGFPIYPEIVAQHFGTTGQCNFYAYDSISESITINAGCSNFAVGGSRIVNPAAKGGAATPLNIPTQLAQAAAAAGGAWSHRDLLLVDGGANDLSDLMVAYLVASRGGVEEFSTFLQQQLDAAVVDPLLATGEPGFAEAGRLYMRALADTGYAALKTHGLERGAMRIAVLNIPDVTLTPRFRTVAELVAASGGQAQVDVLRGLIQEWATTYNAQLQERIGADSRVVLVDFHAYITHQVTDPASYGATNATQASCPVTAVDGMGLPEYSVAACTSATLDAVPPDGLAAGWWRTWIFADDFHLSPYGHQLLADTIKRALVDAGWF